MAKYDWKVEPRDEDWSDDLYAYFLIHINLKKMVEYLTKEFKKDWWFKADYGQDNCYIVAENNDFPVRLFFTFDEGGWADITRHYTDGASYTDDHLGSWHFAKYDIDYSYKMISSNIEEYFNKFEESMKEEKKSLKESSKILAKNKKGKVVGYIEPQKDGSFGYAFGSPSQKEVIMFYVDTLEQAKDRIAEHSYDDVIFESKKSNHKSLKESFEYEGGIPLDELMDILTEEWQENNTNNLLFRESSYYEDEARDENRYIEISSILDFAVPYTTGYSFSNKKIQKQYDESIEELLDEVEDDDFNDVLYEYEPILLLITIDLKEEIIYANVDLGNGVVEDVAREKLADNEKDFRKQIQRMIDAF